jgi:hypothetical protein
VDSSGSGWGPVTDSSEHGRCRALLASQEQFSSVELIQLSLCDDSEFH